jgi:hypothetical protein
MKLQRMQKASQKSECSEVNKVCSAQSVALSPTPAALTPLLHKRSVLYSRKRSVLLPVVVVETGVVRVLPALVALHLDQVKIITVY